MPTFQEADKAKKKQAPGTLGSIGSTIGSFVPTGVTSGLTQSKGFAKASDSIKRAIGVDIHGALGGKSCAEVAEERLAKDLKGGYGGGSGGYQGVTIPGLDQQVR